MLWPGPKLSSKPSGNAKYKRDKEAQEGASSANRNESVENPGDPEQV